MDDMFPFIFTAALLFGALSFLFAYVYLWTSDHLKFSFIFIPIVAVVAGMTCVSLAVSPVVLVAVGVVLAVAEALYFYGPFRVCGWAWPDNKRPKSRRVSGLLMAFATVMAIFISVVAYLHYSTSDSISGAGFGPSGLSVPIIQAIFLWVIIYGLGWWFYVLLLGCTTTSEQTKTGVIENCWIDHYRHIVTFGSDTNAYHFTLNVYKRIVSQPKGSTYSYTVVTGLSGRQFIREAPRLIAIPDRKNLDYASLAEEAAATTTNDEDDNLHMIAGVYLTSGFDEPKQSLTRTVSGSRRP